MKSNIQVVVDFLKGTISSIIVMIGCFLMNFYLNQPLSVVSIFCGLLGFLILYPAIEKWKGFLKFRKNRQE